MANENDIAVDIEVKGVEPAINSIKDLKTAIKAAKDEQIKASEQFGIGSKQYEVASKKVSELRDKVDDLGDATRSLQGSGIERANAGFNQLGEGLRNLDLDKVKTGFSALKTAVAAVGIGLLVQLVTYLYENFDRLSKGSDGLAKALRFVGDIMTSILDTGRAVLNFVSDFIGLTTEAERKAEEATTKFAKASEEAINRVSSALNNQSKNYDYQIALLKAQGKETTDLEKTKLKNIIATNDALTRQLVLQNKYDEKSKESILKYTESATAARRQLEILEATILTNQENARKKDHEKQLAEQKKFNEDKLKASQEAYSFEQSQRKFMQDENKKFIAEQDKLNRDEIKYAQLATVTETEEETARIKRLQRQQDLQELNENVNTQASIAKKGVESLQNLTDLYFMFKKQKAEQGSKAEEELAKKQFKINKALAITSTTIATIQGVMNALSAQSIIPEPFGTIFKVANAASVGIAGAVNIAKISSTQFGGSGTPSVSSAPSASTQTPTVPLAPVEQKQSTTNFDEQGKNIGEKNITVKAYVVETDVTNSQTQIRNIEKITKF